MFELLNILLNNGRKHVAWIVVLYYFLLLSSFEHINYVLKTGELKVIQDNDSCHVFL